MAYSTPITLDWQKLIVGEAFRVPPVKVALEHTSAQVSWLHFSPESEVSACQKVDRILLINILSKETKSTDELQSGARKLAVGTDDKVTGVGFDI